MAKSNGISFNTSGIKNGLKKLDDKFMLAVEAFADSGSKMLESYAKEHKRWENRTGHAVQRLTGDYILVQNGVKIRLMHGVDYGIWLELAHEKKYSIIPETIQIVGEGEIMPAFENMMEKLK